MGTTSAPSMLDPAGAWDGSWELYRNTYQSLLHFPKSSGVPEPDAARKCGFTDNGSQVYRCTLRKGLTFSNGNPLNAAAVKHTFDRIKTINARTGPAQLLESLDRVETSGQDTVIFHLKESNATFPLVLATPAGSLVDPESYPARSLREESGLVGSGPYELSAYEPGEKAQLKKNGRYQGAAEMRNDAVEIRYFASSQHMVKALRAKDIDLTYRGLTPGQIDSLRKDEAVRDELMLKELVGTETRYLVFNTEDEKVAEPAVREAVAQLLDRNTLVRNVYKATAEPLFSMVPSGIIGHTSAFHDVYGEPSKAKAKKLLEDAGVYEPVEFTLWYATDRYGAVTKAEFEEIQRQLNGSGLFKVKIQGKPWNEFQEAYRQGEYPVFGRGWSPDFPDADNYIGPFVGKRNVLGIPYEDKKLTNSILPKSRAQTDRAAASETLKDAQRVLAEDARLLPLWQGRVHIASKEEIAGLEWAVDTSAIMRMWELYRKESW